MEPWGLAEEQYAELQDEVAGLLSQLLQADSSNPPGDVSAAALVFADYFRYSGIEPTLVGGVPERPNCAARLAGTGGARRC